MTVPSTYKNVLQTHVRTQAVVLMELVTFHANVFLGGRGWFVLLTQMSVHHNHVLILVLVLMLLILTHATVVLISLEYIVEQVHYFFFFLRGHLGVWVVCFGNEPPCTLQSFRWLCNASGPL